MLLYFLTNFLMVNVFSYSIQCLVIYISITGILSLSLVILLVKLPYVYIPTTFHPYRPVWYVPDQGLGYIILNT